MMTVPALLVQIDKLAGSRWRPARTCLRRNLQLLDWLCGTNSAC